MNDQINELAAMLLSVSEAKAGSEIGLDASHDYVRFLALCDGGYSSDRFFHFFGRSGPDAHNISAWNRPGLWKENYSLDEKCFVFAENIFGFQFFFDLRGNQRVVKMLDPDTGKTNLCANTFEDFVEDEIFSDEFNSDDRSLAKQFYADKGLTFRPFMHVCCKKPVLLGGNCRDLNNLELQDSLTNLSVTGQIVRQVKGLPPGTPITSINVKSFPRKGN